MPLYMTQFAYTQDAWSALARNPEDRSAVLRQFVEQMGGRLVALYYMFGEYDGFTIVEAPDETAATAMVLAAAGAGHMKASKTTVLLTPQALVEALKKTAGVTYRAPGG